MTRLCLRAWWLAGSLVLAASPLAGLATGYIRLDGIEGEARDAAHRGWIDLQSFETALLTGAATPSPGLGAARLVLHKHIDKASPALLEAATQNRILPQMEMEFVRPVPGGQRFYHFVLDSLRVLDFRHHVASAAANPAAETFTLDFQSLVWTYVEFDADQLPALDHSLVWNVARGSTQITRELAGRLKVRHFRRTGPGEFQIEWLADAGKRYAILQAANVNGPYLPWQQVSVAANGLQTLAISQDDARQFFILAIEEAPIGD